MGKNIHLNASSDDPDMDTLAEEIAKKYLFIETLEIKNRDCFDFHDVSVWGVKDAIIAAFNAGRDSVKKRRKK